MRVISVSTRHSGETDQVPAGVAHVAEEIATNDRKDELGARSTLGCRELKVEELDRHTRG